MRDLPGWTPELPGPIGGLQLVCSQCSQETL